MRIESLSPARRLHNCFQVTPETGEPFLITDQELLSFDLRPGMELEGEQLAQLRQAAARSLALRRAAALLAGRDLSRRELTEQLTRKGVSRENADLAADRMEELGVLNDAAYAAAWVRRGVSRGWGPRRVESELYRRGIHRDLWPDALDTVEDWTAVAADYAAHRRADLSDPAARKSCPTLWPAAALTGTVSVPPCAEWKKDRTKTDIQQKEGLYLWKPEMRSWAAGASAAMTPPDPSPTQTCRRSWRPGSMPPPP